MSYRDHACSAVAEGYVDVTFFALGVGAPAEITVGHLWATNS